MPRTQSKTDVTASLWLVIVGILLQYVFPRSESMEKYLLSYLKYESLLLVAKSSTGVLLLALTYYFWQKAFTHISPAKQEKLLNLIKESCNSKYPLRNNELSAEFQSINAEYASRGFDFLPGPGLGQFADLYIKELYAYTDILLDTILETLDSGKFKLKTESLVLLSQEMILNKANEFNSYFCNLVDHHSKFCQGPQPDILIGTKTSFTTRISKEAALNISKLSSQIELKNIS